MSAEANSNFTRLPNKRKYVLSEKHQTYDLEFVRHLLFQMDNVFHTRVNFLLVAEGIFFMAAATTWQNFNVVLAIALGGILLIWLFTFPSLKLHWRISWLIKELKEKNETYHDYIEIKGIENEKKWWKPTQKLIHIAQNGNLNGWLDTGLIYTWYLSIALTIAWIGFGYACYRLSNEQNRPNLSAPTPIDQRPNPSPS